MVGSSKHMSHLNAPPVTEEVVSKTLTPEMATFTPKPNNSTYDLIHLTMFQRSTYVPIQGHTSLIVIADWQ